MGRKPKEPVVETEKKPKKKPGRPKKDLVDQITPPKSTKRGRKKAEPKEIETLDEIKARLLKKAKSQGYIDQSEIYDELNNYELDEDVITDLISFFRENDVEVLTEEEEEDSLV